MYYKQHVPLLWVLNTGPVSEYLVCSHIQQLYSRVLLAVDMNWILVFFQYFGSTPNNALTQHTQSPWRFPHACMHVSMQIHTHTPTSIQTQLTPQPYCIQTLRGPMHDQQWISFSEVSRNHLKRQQNKQCMLCVVQHQSFLLNATVYWENL